MSEHINFKVKIPTPKYKVGDRFTDEKWIEHIENDIQLFKDCYPEEVEDYYLFDDFNSGRIDSTFKIVAHMFVFNQINDIFDITATPVDPDGKYDCTSLGFTVYFLHPVDSDRFDVELIWNYKLCCLTESQLQDRIERQSLVDLSINLDESKMPGLKLGDIFTNYQREEDRTCPGDFSDEENSSFFEKRTDMSAEIVVGYSIPDYFCSQTEKMMKYTSVKPPFFLELLTAVFWVNGEILSEGYSIEDGYCDIPEALCPELFVPEEFLNEKLKQSLGCANNSHLIDVSFDKSSVREWTYSNGRSRREVAFPGLIFSKCQ